MTTVVPDLTTKVVGFREWSLVGDTLRPFGRFNYRWRPGVNRASCGRPWQHHAHSPSADCACGLHAYHAAASLPDVQLPCRVVGAVTAWGQLQVHENGFRAEYAEPVALAYGAYTSQTMKRHLRRVAERYGVPLVPFRKLAAAAAEHGEQLPDSLLPEHSDPICREPLFRRRSRLALYMNAASFTVNGTVMAIVGFNGFSTGAMVGASLIAAREAWLCRRDG